MAIHVEPGVTGPRTNLAAVLDHRAAEADSKARQAELQKDRQTMEKWVAEVAKFRTESKNLRREELPLLARDARLAPDIPVVQYRYGMSAYLHGQFKDAERALQRAAHLDDDNPQFLLALALFYQKTERWPEAQHFAERLNRVSPGVYAQLVNDIRNRRPPR